MLRMNDIAPTHVYDAADFGRAIRTLRRAKGWNQATLGEWLGVHRVTVAKIEHGGAVSFEVAMRAMALLGAKAVVCAKSSGDPVLYREGA